MKGGGSIVKRKNRCEDVLMRFMWSLILLLGTAECFSRTVTLQWNPVDDKILHYCLYWGVSSRNYTDSCEVRNQTEYKVEGLQDSIRYYFAVKAVDFWGNASDFSNEAQTSGHVAVPDKYELTQSYPNPFNSGTFFGFSLPEANTVEIAIYNAVGQRIKVLEQGGFFAGSYQTHWDGTDFSNSAVSSGVYVCVLRAGKIRLTRSVTLLR